MISRLSGLDRTAGGLPGTRPRPARAAPASPVRFREPVVGLAVRRGGGPHLRAARRRLLPLLRGRHVPQPHGRAVPARARPLCPVPVVRRAVRAGWDAAGAARLGGRVLPPGGEHVRGVAARGDLAELPPVPAPARPPAGAGAVPVPGAALRDLSFLRLGHLRPAAGGRGSPPGRVGDGQGGEAVGMAVGTQLPFWSESLFATVSLPVLSLVVLGAFIWRRAVGGGAGRPTRSHGRPCSHGASSCSSAAGRRSPPFPSASSATSAYRWRSSRPSPPWRCCSPWDGANL